MNRPFFKYVADYGQDAQITSKNTELFHLVAMNNSGSAFWLQLFDAATSPAATPPGSAPAGVPDFEIEIPANSFGVFPFHRDGWPFGKGVYARPVTASGGSTVIGAANCKITAAYDLLPIA